MAHISNMTMEYSDMSLYVGGNIRPQFIKFAIVSWKYLILSNSFYKYVNLNISTFILQSKCLFPSVVDSSMTGPATWHVINVALEPTSWPGRRELCAAAAIDTPSTLLLVTVLVNVRSIPWHHGYHTWSIQIADAKC